MRMPFPFQHYVNVEEHYPNVVIMILIDMPCPRNMSVHLANEHGTGSGAHTSDEQSMLHLRCHLYGQFREGGEHFHVRGESA